MSTNSLVIQQGSFREMGCVEKVLSVVSPCPKSDLPATCWEKVSTSPTWLTRSMYVVSRKTAGRFTQSVE